MKVIKLDTGGKYQRLFSRESGTHGIKSGHVILKQDEEVGEHSTNGLEEVLIILKGKGEVLADKKNKVKIEENSAVYIPPDTIHNVKNTGREILEYIFVTAETK